MLYNIVFFQKQTFINCDSQLNSTDQIRSFMLSWINDIMCIVQFILRQHAKFQVRDNSSRWKHLFHRYTDDEDIARYISTTCAATWHWGALLRQNWSMSTSTIAQDLKAKNKVSKYYKIIAFQFHTKHNKQAKHIGYKLQAVEQQHTEKYKKPSIAYAEVALHISNLRWMKE